MGYGKRQHQHQHHHHNHQPKTTTKTNDDVDNDNNNNNNKSKFTLTKLFNLGNVIGIGGSGFGRIERDIQGWIIIYEQIEPLNKKEKILKMAKQIDESITDYIKKKRINHPDKYKRNVECERKIKKLIYYLRKKVSDVGLVHAPIGEKLKKQFDIITKSFGALCYY